MPVLEENLACCCGLTKEIEFLGLQYGSCLRNNS